MHSLFLWRCVLRGGLVSGHVLSPLKKVALELIDDRFVNVPAYHHGRALAVSTQDRGRDAHEVRLDCLFDRRRRSSVSELRTQLVALLDRFPEPLARLAGISGDMRGLHCVSV